MSERRRKAETEASFSTIAAVVGILPLPKVVPAEVGPTNALRIEFNIHKKLY